MFNVFCNALINNNINETSKKRLNRNSKGLKILEKMILKSSGKSLRKGTPKAEWDC